MLRNLDGRLSVNRRRFIEAANEIQPQAYSVRLKRPSGVCKRCAAHHVPVIESVTGSFICWNLGQCTDRAPFPAQPTWSPPKGSLKTDLGGVE